MTKPTEDQLSFLRSQNIPLSRVYDATGMSTKRYKQEMHRLDMEVAIGVTPCKKSGHTMRTRAGHCVQCGTHNIAFLRRFHEENYVYVASSKEGNFIKVGTAEDTDAREKSLNYFRYGGVSDWVIRYKVFCKFAGRVEQKVHDVLSRHCIHRSYKKQGHIVDCQELFNCCVANAVAAIESYLTKRSSGPSFAFSELKH